MRFAKIGKKSLFGLLFLCVAYSGFSDYATIEGKEYYKLCRKCGENEIEYYFYAPSIENKKISWKDHIDAEKRGLSLICTACHIIHN